MASLPRMSASVIASHPSPGTSLQNRKTDQTRARHAHRKANALTGSLRYSPSYMVRKLSTWRAYVVPSLAIRNSVSGHAEPVDRRLIRHNVAEGNPIAVGASFHAKLAARPEVRLEIDRQRIVVIANGYWRVRLSDGTFHPRSKARCRRFAGRSRAGALLRDLPRWANSR